MKNFFGEYTFWVKQLKAVSGLSNVEVVDAIQDGSIKKWFNQDVSQSHLNKLMWEATVLECGADHFFVETERLAEYLSVCVPKYDYRFLEVMLGGEKNVVGMIHTTGKKALAILFSIGDHGADYSLFFSCPRLGYTMSFNNPKLKNLDIPQGEKPELEYLHSVLFGVGLYIKCFPKSLVQGFPESAKHPAHYKGEKCFSVGAVPQIIDRDRPSGHFRSGHFRFLEHPRYTTKRYQVVFVSDCFVNGRAQTVEDLGAITA